MHFTSKFFLAALAAITINAHAQVPPGVNVSPEVWAQCQQGIDINRCSSTIKPQPCAPGMHWSLKGTGIAHCVPTTTPCPSSGYQTEDITGNLSCRPAGSLSTASATPLPRTPPIAQGNPPPPPPTALYYNHDIGFVGSCSRYGCQINYRRSVENVVRTDAGPVAEKNIDLYNVIQGLYAACPLGSGWNFKGSTVTSGPVTGTCFTDPEPGVVIPGGGPFGTVNRQTEWDIDINGIPK